MSFDLSQYPETSSWLAGLSEKTSLGATRAFHNILNDLYKIKVSQFLNPNTSPFSEIEITASHKKHLISFLILGYDDPLLNDKWGNKIVTDGQRIFIPQSLFFKELKIFKPREDFRQHHGALIKRLYEIFENPLHVDQSPDKTKQDLLDANLTIAAENLFPRAITFPIDVLENAWKNETSIPEENKAPFLDFLKKVEKFKEDLNDDELKVLQTFLVDDFEEKWGALFSWTNQIAPFVVIEEWKKYIGINNWETDDFLKNPDKLKQTWGLLGVLNEFLYSGCGVGLFLRGLKPDNIVPSSTQTKLWWNTTSLLFDKYQKNHYLSQVSLTNSAREEFISGISGSDVLASYNDLDEITTVAAFQNPLDFVDVENNMFRIIVKSAHQNLKAYMDILHQSGWSGKLNDYKIKKKSEKEGKHVCTLWSELLKNPLPPIENVSFLMEKGLSLNSKEAHEDFARWFLNPEFEKESDFFKVTQVILNQNPPFSKELFDGFIRQAHNQYKKSSWNCPIDYGKRLDFLIEKKWIDLDHFTTEEKKSYLKKLQAVKEPSLKTSSIVSLIQRACMNEVIDQVDQAVESPKISNKVRL